VAALQQNGLANERADSESDSEDDNTGGNSDDDADPEPENQYLRAPRHSKLRQPQATTVSYYPGSWKEVLENAKNRFVRHVFLNQGFPVRHAHIEIARDILHEEIAKGRAKKLTLDNGISLVSTLLVWLIPFSQPMNRLVKWIS
jgi:hypothetical protein